MSDTDTPPSKRELPLTIVPNYDDVRVKRSTVYPQFISVMSAEEANELCRQIQAVDD